MLKDFYIPALKHAKYYDRAVGYFSTSLLAYALKGISSIVKNDGAMRLIVGYPLEEEEFEALKEGDNLKLISDTLSLELEKILENASTGIEQSRLQIFTLLVATNRLKLKFAFKVKGMYHEKIGIIKDENGNKVLFHGSANETTNAINPDLNFESITVYKSWQKEIYTEYAEDFEKGLEDLWAGIDDNIITIDMPSEMYEKISNSYRDKSILINDFDFDEIKLISELGFVRDNHYPIIPKSINGQKFGIYKHQEEALKEWFSHGRKGLFRLATGSGKTITAMYGVSTIFEKACRPRKMLLVVAVPYQTLAEQWFKELSLFNMKPIKCFNSRQSWENKLSDRLTLLQNGNIDFVSVIVVNRTLMTQRFNSLITRINKESIFFVGDECHHHANENAKKYLPAADFRMGLSATPFIDDEDWEYDDEPNTQKELLTEYYGNIVAEYGLANALADGILAPYHYHLVLVQLTLDETQAYLKLSNEIARLISINKYKDNIALSNAIRKRNKIISNADMKSVTLDKLLSNHDFTDKSHTLFYVGEGSALVDGEENVALEKDISQLEAISRVVVKNNWKPSKFTSLESSIDRQKLMCSFVEGTIDALVSMRVLDEGVDIPQCKRAFILASSRNSRQFIQRRGRILRKSKGKDFAEIYDFIVLPSNEGDGNKAFNNLVFRELKRAMDFVRLSNNREQCENEAQKIATEYDIDLREV
ncbi:MAG: DEAD/DEAH box helicase family protein [Colwellia sp.]|nr:DEAD/DEAH box helicase family protein [Colwellia sp.]